MITVTTPVTLDARQPSRRSEGRSGIGRSGRGTAFATLVARRLALSARTPREVIVPLLTPILIA